MSDASAAVHSVRSPDGTRVAYERSGYGPLAAELRRFLVG